MTQAMVTSAVPFAESDADAVDAALDRLGANLVGDGRETLFMSGVHFLSITVVRGGPRQPTYLVFEITADGDADDARQSLSDRLTPWCHEILDAAKVERPENVAAFLKRYDVRTGQGLYRQPGLDFQGTPGMTVPRILAEFELARVIRDYLDLNSRATGPLSLLADIRRHVREDDRMRPLLVAEPVPRLPAQGEAKFDAPFLLSLVGRGALEFLWPLLLPLGALVAISTYLASANAGIVVGALTFVVGLSVVAVATVAVLLLAYLTLRRLEGENTPDDRPPDPVVLGDVLARENRSQQNHLAAVSTMQGHWLRAVTLRVAFFVIREMVRRRFRPGFLGEISTIHFARWVKLPGTDKLLFFSNYGGSWESYLEDFVTRASFGLTGVWSNALGFPRASNLFGEGASDGDRFKRWARRQQRPSRFWYSAYPHVTTARIRTNAAIRQGLCNATTVDEVEAWLGLFGSRVRPDALLETDQVQTLLFGGLSKHPHAALLAVALPHAPVACREWLASVEPKVTFGEEPPPDLVTNLAISSPGLGKLGLPDAVQAHFPPAFRMGMGHPVRARVLSDTGEDKPATWLWGGPDDDLDAVLLVYAADRATLDLAVADHVAGLARYGARLVHQVMPKPLPMADGGARSAVSEPFGFVDGVSQPIVRGTRRWMRQSDAIHVVEAGEFVLGYPDGRGYFPPSPSVPASQDPDNLLPLVDPVHSRGAYQPEFTGDGARGARDFGRNGSFLVVRQLRQDVDRFHDYLGRAAERYKDHPAAPRGLSVAQARAWIGAKMIGRWPNGTSLVRYPHGPGRPRPGQARARPDNEFLYGTEDPLGERCPLGAHIRRANPRDSLAPGSDDELSIVNRHRILRIGRAYETAGDDGRPTEQGLLFMCLNADIERQFEFIQQTWFMGRQFHGLENEVDPVTGRGGKMGRLTVPSPQGPLHLTGIEDFVSTRGGGYFFMPGRQALGYLSGPLRAAGLPGSAQLGPTDRGAAA
ncbi:Dyp-type peroxidase [uncultured Enterovirga sp.]|uniref:Dyp-type peroxidase n=1 Tax=uncultured Enterovirga sp. TaxID=2026352 RepID=UPI0035CA7998